MRGLEVVIDVPCRRCAKCLQFRQMRWRQRAIAELHQAAGANRRTWFVTLTFDPPHLAGIIQEARRLMKVGTPEDELHKFVDRAAYRHLQRYFKRLRKEGAKFRYLAVYERGEENGRSHYHLFLHEKGPRPILKETIERQWRSIVHARLVRGEDAGGAASYLTKYATKSLDVRPRASAGYGKTDSLPEINFPKESFFGVPLLVEGGRDHDTPTEKTSVCDPALEHD